MAETEYESPSRYNYMFIGVLIVVCAVLIPFYITPMFQESEKPQVEQPKMRKPPRGHQGQRNFPEGIRDHFPPHAHPGMNAFPNNAPQADKSSSGRGGIMSFALPIYSVGIVLYVVYVFYKFFTKGFSNDKTCRKRKPTLEQITNYKQFLEAKDECVRRIAEERNNSKISSTQLDQLEIRLAEAEIAMHRAMQKMGIEIPKSTESSKDPLTQTLEDLRSTLNRRLNKEESSASNEDSKEQVQDPKGNEVINENTNNQSSNNDISETISSSEAAISS